MPATPSGIVYPSLTDEPNVPGDMQVMADSIEALLTGLGKSIPYSPNLFGAVLGAGAVSEGYYSVIGDWVNWQFRIEFGTAPSFTTTVLVDLPAPAWVGGGSQVQNTLGSWIFRDDTAPDHYSGSIGMWSGSGVQGSFAGAWTGSRPSTRLSQLAPLQSPTVLQVGDVLSGGGTYRKA